MLQWKLLTTDQFPLTKGIMGSSSHRLLQLILFVKTVLKPLSKSNQKKNINKFHSVNNIK